jgi:hypothetical protein
MGFNVGNFNLAKPLKKGKILDGKGYIINVTFAERTRQ